MHYLLFYEVGHDYIERRTEFRGVHLELGWKAAERGELVLGGALANPVDDVRGTAEYRKLLIPRMLTRAVREITSARKAVA